MNQRDEVSRVSTLLQVQKEATRALEESLKREQNLSYQLQLRADAFQRTADDVEQRLRVGVASVSEA